MFITDTDKFRNYLWEKYIRFAKKAIAARKEGKDTTYLNNKAREYLNKIKMFDREIELMAKYDGCPNDYRPNS